MAGIDAYGLASAGLAEFGATVVNPLHLLVLVVAALAFAATPRALRVIGPVSAVLWAAPGALAAPLASEAGMALAGAAAGGWLVAEVVMFFVLPLLRTVAIVTGTLVDLVRLAFRRLGGASSSRPREEP